MVVGSESANETLLTVFGEFPNISRKMDRETWLVSEAKGRFLLF